MTWVIKLGEDEVKMGGCQDSPTERCAILNKHPAHVHQRVISSGTSSTHFRLKLP